LLYPSKKERKWYLHDLRKGSVSEIDLKVLSRYDTLSAYSSHEAMKFKEILLRNDISLVYSQHLFNYPLLLPISATELGIPFVISLHDYYAICHKYNLIDIFGKYCQPDKIPIESCDVCLGSSPGLKLGAQTKRRDLMAEILRRAAGIHCVSLWQRDLIGSIYPEFRERMQIIEPGCEGKLQVQTANHDNKLRVVVPGNLGFHKGASVLLEIAAYFADVLGDRIQFFIPFTVQSPQRELLANLQNVRFGTKTYNPGEQLEIYKEADVALFLSIWPETYLIALSEAWRMGVPAVVTDLGAPSDRVQDGVNGWKVRPNDAGQVIYLLGRILDDPKILDGMRDELKKTRIPSSNDFHREVEAFIERILKENPVVPSSPGITESQIAWLKSQIKGYPATILPWGKIRVDHAKGILPVKAWRYIRTFGPRRFLGAALIDLGRKLGRISAEPDRSVRSGQPADRLA
jgi:glycosyltransferase involved in cell wall biosynthesis